MSFHSVPVTYPPKRDAVFEGRCTQTIRLGKRYERGDEVLLFEWTGQPYRSKWGRRKRVRLTAVLDALLTAEGVVWAEPGACGWNLAQWGSPKSDELAARDGIDPPTGNELKLVLEMFHCPFPLEGVDAQILRW